jgi:general L-amino acid transport system permease protein
MEPGRHPVRAAAPLKLQPQHIAIMGRRARDIAIQALALALILAAFIYLTENAVANMARRNIASGFAFLSNPAGFGVPMTLIAFDESSTYGRAFLVALLNTLLVSAVGIVFATILGFAIGIARLSRNWLVARLAGAYVETIRNVPLLLQIFVWYFAVLRALPPPRQSLSLFGMVYLNNRGVYVPAPVADGRCALAAIAFVVALLVAVAVARWARRRREMTGRSFPAGWVAIGLPVVVLLAGAAEVRWEMPVLRGFNFGGGAGLIPEFAALAIALSIYTASFIAENVRSGIMSVPRAQMEAAYALGLTRGQTLRLVVIPQALRVIVPPLTGQYLNLIKNSSLGAAIAYPELVALFGGTVLNQTGQAIEVIAITMGVYLLINLTISAAMNRYNRSIARVER